MTKYRITSLPQSLPKAQKGLFNKKNKIAVRNGEVKLFPNLFGNRKKSNVDTEDQSDNAQYNWSDTTPELMQPGQESFELKPKYAPTPEFTQADTNLSSTLSKIQEERNRLAQEKENRDWEEMMQKREEKFKTSKKYDKIEPLLTIDSEGYSDEDLAYFQESGYFPVIDSKTNKISLYPANEISSRIINNGLRTDEIVKKLGIGDAKSVKAAFGDLMNAADNQYSATVQNKLLQKSLDEGISLEDAAKKLSGKLGTEKGLQKYVAPTNDLINNYIDEIKKNVNQAEEKEIQSMYYDNRNPNQGYSPKIDYNSYDPGLKYNMDYYNNTNNWGQFLKDYSDYNKEYNKEYADSFYNKQNQTADKLNLPVSDRTGNLKNQQDVINQNISLTKKVGDASTEAGNKTINKKYIEQLQADMARVSDPLVKYELSKKLDAVKNNPEAFSKLLKGFDSGEALSKEDEEKINALTFSILQKESNQDTVKAGVDRPKLTTSDKVFDVLANPFDAFKYSNQGGLNNMWTSGMGYNERKLLERANPGLSLGTQDNLVGNALNTWNPMRFARDVDSDLDRGDYESAGLEALEFATPAIFSKAARAGRLAKDASKFFPTGSITPGVKGFTGAAFDAMNPYFAYQAIRPGGDFNRSYDAFQSGDVLGGLEEGAYGALGLLGLKGVKGIKELNTPITKPFNASRVGFKKGGELPTYQGPIRSIVKAITPVVKNAAGYTERRNIVQSLKDLGYLGPQTMGMDMLRAAKSDEALNKLMKAAIEFDRTGYRQVTGDFKPVGDLLGGYGNRGRYDMTKQHYGTPRSEVENIKLAGVDISDPMSLGAYQAVHIPMQQYGYRAGMPDMSRMDGLYLASLPGKKDYGPYQFKVTQDLDFNSGNWQDWYHKYILGKQPLYSDGYLREDLQPSELYFNIGNSKAGIANATGLNTREWASGKGNKIGTIDPNFPFMDLRNMSAEDYMEMEKYKQGLIDKYNTGWRGEYKNGGSMELELTPKQIKEYIQAGYIIEDI